MIDDRKSDRPKTGGRSIRKAWEARELAVSSVRVKAAIQEYLDGGPGRSIKKLCGDPKVTGISDSQVSRWQNGEILPSLFARRCFERLLGKPPDWTLDESKPLPKGTRLYHGRPSSKRLKAVNMTSLQMFDEAVANLLTEGVQIPRATHDRLREEVAVDPNPLGSVIAYMNRIRMTLLDD